MTRTVVTARIDYDDADCSPDFDARVGWFDRAKATCFEEGTRWDGNNKVGLCSDRPWEHEALYRTAGGRWVLNHWSNWQGSTETYHFISDDEAHDWLIRSEDNEEALAEHFDLPDEAEPRTMGRPPIGDQISVAMPTPLLVRIDAAADVAGVSRSAWIRSACEAHLAAGRA